MHVPLALGPQSLFAACGQRDGDGAGIRARGVRKLVDGVSARVRASDLASLPLLTVRNHGEPWEWEWDWDTPAGG